MCIKDKDLASIQEVRDLIARSKAAQAELAQMSQAQIDKICKSIADAGVRNAKRLAVMANEETGFGKAEDKVIKNVFGSKFVWEAIKDMKTIGEIARDDVNKTRSIAVPVGIVAGLVPSTNPTSTALYKSIISIKAGNSIIISPHPNAKNCILEAVKVIRQAIAEAGGNEDIVLAITIPTIQATDALMKHNDTAIILATGGSAMVRAAYSSGTPAIGVGPGNGPAYIDESADVALACKRIIQSKTFDNGTICASEQSVICIDSMVDKVKAALEAEGAYFLSDAEIKQLGKFILRANGTMNPQIVGKSAEVIADLAGLTIPAGTKVLVARETGVGRGHPYSNEKLCPILGFYSAPTYQEVCDQVVAILNWEGAGHTFSMHTNDYSKVDYFAVRVPASRIIVNTPSTLGGIGASTALMPALTLGCGAVGGSATSENVGPMELLNVRKVAEGLIGLEEIKAQLPDCEGGICKYDAAPSLGEVDIDALVSQIMKRLQNA